MLLFAVVSMAQNKITVSGVVSDKTGMTVIGATVSVKGAPQQGVVTGLDGDYKITKGDYYRVKGVHSVFQGDITETTGTCTSAVPLN